MTITRFSVLLLAGLATAACSEAEPLAESDMDVAADVIAPAPGAAAVLVVHGINGTDLGAAEALAVDVSVDGACVLEGLEFRAIAGPLELPAGTYDIQVRLADAVACTGALAIDAPGVGLAAGTAASIVAHLDEAGAPTAGVFPIDPAAVPGRTRLVAHHTAAFGAVDIGLDGAVAFGGVTNGQQGAADVRPGRQTLTISPAGTTTAVFEASPVLRPFTAVLAYAVGTPGNDTFEVLLKTVGLR